MKFWLHFTFAIFLIANRQHVEAAATSSAHLPLEARDDSGSQEDDVISTSYVLPNQIFNDGKPYYASKDPISGQLDFNAKKPAGIETAANEVIDPKEKIVLNNGSPNIHDFLNLPVKYSSSKFVYPLVSSSYANLKYQGSNKNYITNKKPTSVEAMAITPTPDYNHQSHYTIPTTKLMPVPSKAPELSSTATTATITTKTTPTTSKATTTTTSKKPTTVAGTSTTAAVRPTSTSIQTSIATSTSILSSPKYTSVTRRPIPIASTTVPPKPQTPTTRKKFMPTKKYSPTAPTAPTSTSMPTMRFPDQHPLRPHGPPYPPQPTASTTTTTTTRQPTKPSSIFPTDASTVSTTKFSSSNTKPPISITEQQLPALPSQSSLLGGSTRIPNLDPADVYQTLGQKNTPQFVEQKPSMTIADIFNSIAEEESAVASNNQGNQGFDAQGNLMQPIAPSKPSPFAMQEFGPHGPFPTRPTFGTTLGPHSTQQLPQQQQQHPHINNDQKVISGSQETYSNEYVSYQVQQPNVMQYRPAPGAINNVVISPGQNSASFVLGSQQQVGPNAFGSVEKEPLFGKERPVQYGTVINEPLPQQPGKPGNFPRPSQQPSYQNSGNSFISSEEPPAPPSPYQQLPLIGNANLHPHTTKPQSTGSENGHQNPDASVQTPTNYQQQTPLREPSLNGPDSLDTKELLVSTNIRFPVNEEQSEEQISGPVAAGPPSGPPVGPQVNGHAQPLSLQQIQHSNQVVFPKPKDEDSIQVSYQNQPGAEDIQIQQHEVLTMNQHKQKLSFPQLSEQHTPSTHMEPPPPPPPNAEHPEHHKRPPLNRPPPAFAYNEYTRKPIPGITRPNPDRHLPNILPQFRPNAKISSGHPSPNFNQEPGNIRIPPGSPMKRPNPIHQGSPQFAHRRQPLMQPQRFPANRASDFPMGPSPMTQAAEANRRVYRLPPYGGQGFPYVDRVYNRRPVPYAPLRPLADNYGIERHAPGTVPELYKTINSADTGMPPERMAAFEEEDLVINDPPQPVTPGKDRKSVDESKLEPVVTLQMLQSQKKPLSLPTDDTGSGEIQVPSEAESNDGHLEKPVSQNGLYVVYPMNGKDKDGNEISNPKEPLPAIAHVDPGTGTDYQNTPFSVVRDQPQEPILTVKNKKPQSLQQHNKTPMLKDKFPYPIEKPDPSYTELNTHTRVPGVLIAPRIVHGVYPSGTETPIAIAYTPTEPNPYKKYTQKYSNVNLATSVIGEIRHETQTEEGLSTDYDTRGQHFEKNFMAPFYPSVSLETATSAPANGWNILPSTSDTAAYEKNQINRADIGDNDGDSPDGPNKNFEIDNFQPELQGGFKPIYPPGYKLDNSNDDETDAEHMQRHESNNRPLALPLRMETTTTTSTTSSTTANPTTLIPTTTPTAIATTTSHTTPKPQISTTKLSATTTQSPVTDKALSTSTTTTKSVESHQTETLTKASPTTPKPTQRKKTPFETSLEALLFGDDEDFENGARKQKTKANSGPRIVPRMGPRNLKVNS